MKCKEVSIKYQKNKSAAADHQQTLKASLKDKKENGGYHETANVVTSIHNAKHGGNQGDGEE